MKKLVFLALCAISVLSFFSGENFFASAETTSTYYAKVSDNAYLYSQAVDSADTRTFKIKSGYFVLLTGEADKDFYICRYGDVLGYVKKSEVTAMDGTPQNPYVTTSMLIKAPDGFDLRSSPKNLSNNKIMRLDFLQNNVFYYGTLDGDEYVPGLTNVWYYCKYQDEQTKRFGYLYSDYCHIETPITENNETFPLIANPTFSNGLSNKSSSTQLSGTAKTLIIIGVCLPCVAILYFLIKPTLIANPKKPRKSKSEKKKRGDYFEFDESDLN